MTACPPTEQLLSFASGNLAPDANATVESHVGACGPCRQTLSSLPRRTPATSFGRYQVEAVLGSGGMGIVYRAWDPKLARPVAIKVVRQAGHDAALRLRLVREAQSLARLSHPNVCHVYDVGTEGDEVWVAMELIDGSTLRQWVTSGLPAATILAALLGAAEGIAAAHAAGLIHRDIKPENVLVTRDGRPVVTDFGLARIDLPVDPQASTAAGEPQLTATGAIVGTPAYLAPEQLTGDALDARVDQFAWAAMAWELLTGARPFPILPAVRLDAIRAGVTPPPGLAKRIAAVLARAMAVAPGDRFSSMRQLIDSLQAAPTPTRSRMPLLLGSSAVVAALATVVAWQVLRDPAREPAVRASSELSGTRTPSEAVRRVDPPIEARAPAATAPGSGGAPGPEHASPATVAPPPTRRVATAPRTTSTAGAAGSGSSRPHLQAVTEAAAPTPAPRRAAYRMSPFRRVHAEASLAWCRLPLDPKHPDPALGRARLDWGPVTRREVVTAKLVDREVTMLLYEVRGARKTYRFDGGAHAPTLGDLDAQPGQLVVICEDTARAPTELHELPGTWRGALDVLQSTLPVSAPPRVAAIAKLAPLHIDDTALRRAAAAGKLPSPEGRRFLVKTRVEAAEGASWDMRGWWLEVPPGTPGAELVEPGKSSWFVVEQPRLDEHADGGPRLVLRAAAIQADMFPR